MPYLIVDQQSVFYTTNRLPTAETDGRPTLLFIHGAGGSRLDWPPNLRRWGTHPTITLDLPGHGKSDAPGRNTISDYADVVSSVVEALQRPSAVLVGHSMGGAVAQTAALRRPAWLAGLVLIGTGAKMVVSDHILSQVRDNPAAVADFFAKYAWSRDTAAEIRTLSREKLLQNDPQVLYGDYIACHRFDIRARLGEIQVPALIISGGEDKFMPAEHGRYLHEKLPHSEHVHLDQTGHMIPLEQPTAVAAALTDWLQNHSPSS